MRHFKSCIKSPSFPIASSSWELRGILDALTIILTIVRLAYYLITILLIIWWQIPDYSKPTIFARSVISPSSVLAREAFFCSVILAAGLYRSVPYIHGVRLSLRRIPAKAKIEILIHGISHDAYEAGEDEGEDFD